MYIYTYHFGRLPGTFFFLFIALEPGVKWYNNQ